MNKEDEDFMNMATHELRSPVTVLKAYVQLASGKLQKEGLYEYVGLIEKMDVQLDKLLNLISDMLDSTQAKGGSLSYNFNIFNINECLSDCVEGFRASNSDLIIECHLMKPGQELRGDKDRIEQVISNFISNSIKYSSGQKLIKVTSEFNDKYVVVKVKDNGMGISKEKQKQVFERFYRTDSVLEKKIPGLGLGLFICEKIIKAHRGEIGLNSEEGSGSEFWFSLPLDLQATDVS